MTEQNQEKETGKKIVFAEADMTVHRALGPPVTVNKEKFWNVESVLLMPGDTFDFDELPSYQQNALLNDKIDGLRLLTQEEVEVRLQERDRVLGLAQTLKVEV